MKYIRVNTRDLPKSKRVATRPAFGFCPKCGGAFFGRGICRRCRKGEHIRKGQGVRHV